MTDLCREFRISRQTGYNLKERFFRFGPDAFVDRSHRPHSSPWQTPGEIVELVASWRRKHPTWGPKKLKHEMEKFHPGLNVPAQSTIGEILSRQNLVKPRKRRRKAVPSVTPLREAHRPNDVWCADFKGEFRLGNGQYCYPLTISDHFSRFLLDCEAQENKELEPVRITFEEVFAEYGLPNAIRIDNGTPFASTGLAGLSKLSAWWMTLGIVVERIEPGHPEQNGRHERMHLTLKQEATRPPKQNILQQQEHFDHFRQEFNETRPHEALGMKYPKEAYTLSERRLPEDPLPLQYPLHDYTRQVYSCGSVSIPGSRRCYISSALAGLNVGLREIDTALWLVSFMDLDLGVVAAGEKKLKIEPHQPFTGSHNHVSTISPD